MFPKESACSLGIHTINVTATYRDQDEWSPDDCMIKYRTDGAGDWEISGQTIKDVASQLLADCEGHGSYGTGNCPTCHVTMNYRWTHRFFRPRW